MFVFEPVDQMFGRVASRRRAETGKRKDRVRDGLFARAQAGVEASPPEASARPESDRTLSSSSDRSDPTPPTLIGHFVVVESLGHGGMGRVYRTYDPKLERQVAVKIVHPDVGARHASRMEREAQALARLNHLNVVQVYEVGEYEGRPFIAMELVDGETVEDWQKRRRHEWTQCVDIYLQAGRGLAAAHARGVIHRDFKPANCIIGEDGRVQVLDFGLAADASMIAAADGRSDPTSVAPTVPDSGTSSGAMFRRMTEDGAVMGTPAYMAPEQFSAHPVDARSDQFSFCVALYEALYGQPPFADPGIALIDMAAGAECLPRTPPPSRRVPRALWRALKRGLSAEPDARWPSMDALLEQLEDLRRRTSVRRRALYVVGAVGLLAGALWAWPSPSPCTDMRSELAGAWDDTRREEVHAAFGASDRGHAPQTLERVEMRLDSWADDWVQTSTQICEAARAEAQPAADVIADQRRCLYNHRAAVAHDVRLLASGDARVIDAAVDLLADASSVTDCAAPGSDASRLPSLASQLLRPRVAHMRSLQSVGHYDEGLAMVDLTLPRAQELGDHALLAELELLQGLFHMGRLEYEQARSSLDAARERAMRHGVEEIGFEATVAWMELVGVTLEQTDQALALEQVVRPLAERNDPEGLWSATALGVLGQVHGVRGDHQQAETYFHRALADLPPEGGNADFVRIRVLDGLARVQHEQLNFAGAQELYHQAYEVSAWVYGPMHYRSVHEQTHLGVVLARSGKSDEALKVHAEVAEILEQAPEQRRQDVALLEVAFGGALVEQKRYPEAEIHLRRAVESYDTVLDDDQPRMGRVRLQHAFILEKLERYDEAQEVYDTILMRLEPHERTLERTFLMAKAHRALGRLRKRAGDLDAEENHYRRGIELLEREGSSDERLSGLLASLSNLLGDVLLKQEHFEGAEHLYIRAREIYEGFAEPEWLRIGHTVRRLGKLEMARGDHDRARTHLLRALDIYQVSKASPDKIAKVEELLSTLPAAIPD